MRATHRASVGSGAGKITGRGRPPYASASCGSAQTSAKHSWCRCGPGGVERAVTGEGAGSGGREQGEKTLPQPWNPLSQDSVLSPAAGPGFKNRREVC